MYHSCAHNWSALPCFFFQGERGHFGVAGLFFKALSLLLGPPSESQQSGEARYAGSFLKIGRWLTSERLGPPCALGFVFNELTGLHKMHFPKVGQRKINTFFGHLCGIREARRAWVARSHPPWLAWIFSFDPPAATSLLLCCSFIIYRHAVTGQTPSIQLQDWGRVKISFGIIARKELKNRPLH